MTTNRSDRDAAMRPARARARHEEQALHDPLTGLANRRLLLDRLALALARTSRTAEPVTVFLLGLDGFASVNERLGHDAGDQVLCAVGRVLSASVRPADTVARIGRDEFVVACEGVAEDRVGEVSRRLAGGVASAWDGPLPVTASVGAACSVPDESAELMLVRADAAMHDVKRARA